MHASLVGSLRSYLGTGYCGRVDDLAVAVRDAVPINGNIVSKSNDSG